MAREYFKFIDTSTNYFLNETLFFDEFNGLINDPAINEVLEEIYLGYWKNKPLIYLSNHVLDEKLLNTYIKSTRITKMHSKERLNYQNAIILNNDKKEFIDLSEYIYLWDGDRNEAIHPFGVLTAADKELIVERGAYINHQNRGRWANDRFVVVFDNIHIPNDFVNITKDCLFYTKEDRSDDFKRKTIKISNAIDNEIKIKLIQTKPIN